MSVFQYSFIEPVLTQRLESEKVDEEYSALFFMSIGVSMIFACHFSHYIENLLGYKSSMQMSMIMLGIICSLMGPFPFFFIPHALWPTGILCLIAGFFEGVCLVPVVSEIMRVHSHFPDKESLNDYACGLFTTFYALGDILGPITGNALYLNFGFAWTCNIIGGIIILVGLAYILFC